MKGFSDGEDDDEEDDEHSDTESEESTDITDIKPNVKSLPDTVEGLTDFMNFRLNSHGRENICTGTSWCLFLDELLQQEGITRDEYTRSNNILNWFWTFKRNSIELILLNPTKFEQIRKFEMIAQKCIFVSLCTNYWPEF